MAPAACWIIDWQAFRLPATARSLLICGRQQIFAAIQAGLWRRAMVSPFSGPMLAAKFWRETLNTFAERISGWRYAGAVTVEVARRRPSVRRTGAPYGGDTSVLISLSVRHGCRLSIRNFSAGRCQ